MHGLTFSESAAHLEEPQWLAAAQQGEPAALEWIFHTYHRPVYSLCYRLLSRAVDAEDAAQAAFVAAFKGLAKFRCQSSLKTWLYRIAVNESLTILRQRQRSPGQLDDKWSVRDGAPEIVRLRVCKRQRDTVLLCLQQGAVLI